MDRSRRGSGRRSARPDSRPGGSIRRRLVTILALPGLAVLLLLGYVTVVEVADYRSSTATTEAVETALAVQELVLELQTERGLTAGLLGGNVGFRAEIPPARERVDARRAAVEQRVGGDGEVAERVRRALGGLDGLSAIRQAADSRSANRAGTFEFFTDRIATLNGIEFGLGQVTDGELRRNVAALEALARVTESAAQERAFLNGVFSAGGFNGEEFLQFAAMRAAKQIAYDDFTRHATDRQREAGEYVMDTGAAREAAYFEQVALASADGRRLQVNPQSWWSALTTVLDDLLQMQRYVGSEIQARAEQRQIEATQRVGALAGIVLLCLVGAFLLLLVASRSITRPLAGLAAEADNLATERLPVAVSRAQALTGEDLPRPPEPFRPPARASAEIRSVATALDRVQSVAYQLATEQAMLRRNTSEALANLGRRNQNLLRRQLGFITELERQESDPTGLANLFELDHLATRMRRNAESLLVLVGASAPRQWSAALPIADVIRAAISEVEEYRRVTLRRVDDAYLTGTVVSGLAHLLAELIENGLTFSPPDCDVEIQGRRIGDGYLIAITDQGVGMEVGELAVANSRLRGEDDFLLAPTRYLGHYVVGQLARQLGADVQLAPSPVTGVTARVVLPAEMLAVPPELPSQVMSGISARPAEAAAPVAGTVASVPAGEQVVPVSPVGSQLPAGPAAPAPALGRPSVEYVSAAGPTADAAPPPPAFRRLGSGAYPLVDSSPRAAAARAEAVGVGVAVDEPERTANGLRKRPPRQRRTEAAGTAGTTRAAKPSPSVSDSTGERGQVVNDSPAEVRARLTALRAGVSRAESATAEPAAAVTDGVSTEPWRSDDR
ncbi:nitrate- and nitrite sensing domain-containing protein [Micromonospora sp. NPDC049891]|uniref:sensor histidine kinase n=1 Tax=Micromonospora sp. NPDC049891 TaxID=3155655 RepID=UPI0033C5252F